MTTLTDGTRIAFTVPMTEEEPARQRQREAADRDGVPYCQNCLATVVAVEIVLLRGEENEVRMHACSWRCAAEYAAGVAVEEHLDGEPGFDGWTFN